MKQVSISAAALLAMTGVLVMAWQAPTSPVAGVRFAQVSQNPGQTTPSNVNPVTPTPGAPSKTAIPEKIGEPVQSTATPSPPSDNLGNQPAPARELDLRQPSPSATPPAGQVAPPPRG